MMLLYVQCGTVKVQPKVNYIDRPLAVSIFFNVAPFEKSLDTPDLMCAYYIALASYTAQYSFFFSAAAPVNSQVRS